MIKETKLIRVEEYVASDGKRFENYEKCAEYEFWLENKDMQVYLDKHAIGMWNEQWEGIGGFLGQGGNLVYLVVADETIVEWSRHVSFLEDLEDYAGQAVFIATDGWVWGNSWEFIGSLNGVLFWFEQDLKWLQNKKNELLKEGKDGSIDTEE